MRPGLDMYSFTDVFSVTLLSCCIAVVSMIHVDAFRDLPGSVI